jgi:hypothetical protein
MLAYDTVKELNLKNLKLAKEVRRKNNIPRGSSSEEAYSFIITVLNLVYLNGLTDRQIEESITDSRRDGGFDAIVISNRDRTVSIYDCRKGGFSYSHIESFKNNIEKYIFDFEQNLSGLSEVAQKRIAAARKKIEKDWELNIFVVRLNKDKVTPSWQTRSLLNELDYVSVQPPIFLDTNELVKYSFSVKLQRSNHIWKINSVKDSSKKDTIIIKKRGAINSLFTRVTLKEIVELQDTFVREEKDLFDANVRGFQKKRALSNKIIGSIMSSPSKFYVFHNGLTFACSKINPISITNYKIYNPQVINGCQTVNTIYEAYKDSKISAKKLSQASILCRFYALKEENIEKVCEATNTQVQIKLWDLRSNDRIQQFIELALSAKEIKYKRKTTSSKSEKQVFITDLAQWIYSCKFQKPAEAKNKKASLFDLFSDKEQEEPLYKKIFPENISMEDVYHICKIGLYARERIKKIKKRTFEKDADLHFIAAIYQLSRKKGSDIRKFDETRKIIRKVVNYLRRKYGKDYTYNKMFSKTDETWRLIKKRL